MQTKLMLSVTAGLAVVLSQATPDIAKAQSRAALTGQVTSDAEGAMEGVVVSAQKAGSIVLTSVTTNEKGQYSFPADRLEPGKYDIAIRAVGYDLSGSATADVTRRRHHHDQSQAREDQEPRPSAQQRRMDDEHPGHGRTEGLPPQLHKLPHPGAHRALDP